MPTYAFHTKSQIYSPRETRNLDLISQYTTDLLYLKVESNGVPDALSHIQVNATIPHVLDFPVMATAQARNISEMAVARS